MFNIITTSQNEKADRTFGKGKTIVKTFPGYMSIDERLFETVVTNQNNMWAGYLTEGQINDPAIVVYVSALRLYHKYSTKFAQSQLSNLTLNTDGVVSEVDGNLQVVGGTFYVMIEQNKEKDSDWSKLAAAGVEVVQVKKGTDMNNAQWYGVYLKDNGRNKDGVFLTYEYMKQNGGAFKMFPEYAQLIKQPTQPTVNTAVGAALIKPASTSVSPQVINETVSTATTSVGVQVPVIQQPEEFDAPGIEQIKPEDIAVY
jgi:hypothetical protein